jgi:uncharacterized protein DUF6584
MVNGKWWIDEPRTVLNHLPFTIHHLPAKGVNAGRTTSLWLLTSEPCGSVITPAVATPCSIVFPILSPLFEICLSEQQPLKRLGLVGRNKMRALENAELELAKGNLWRAREILQGSIPNAGYDCELFEKLGTVFLRMGDLPEAGRFLFLSGRRGRAYDQAIQIFLSKHRKDLPRDLFATFPRPAKLSTLSEYPDSVRLELMKLGFPEVLKDKRGTMLTPAQEGGRFGNVVALLILGSILVLLLLGVIKVIEIWHWLKPI